MRWIKASEGIPKEEGIYWCRINPKERGKVYFDGKAFKGWDFDINAMSFFEWLDESDPTPGGVTAEAVENLYDAFANWYHDDGSYDNFLSSEAMKKIDEYASLKLAEKDKEIAELKVQVEHWVGMHEQGCTIIDTIESQRAEQEAAVRELVEHLKKSHGLHVSQKEQWIKEAVELEDKYGS